MSAMRQRQWRAQWPRGRAPRDAYAWSAGVLRLLPRARRRARREEVRRIDQLLHLLLRCRLVERRRRRLEPDQMANPGGMPRLDGVQAHGRSDDLTRIESRRL